MNKKETKENKETKPLRKVTQEEKNLIKELAKAGCIYVIENQLHGAYNIAIKDEGCIPDVMDDFQIRVENEMVS